MELSMIWFVGHQIHAAGNIVPINWLKDRGGYKFCTWILILLRYPGISDFIRSCSRGYEDVDRAFFGGYNNGYILPVVFWESGGIPKNNHGGTGIHLTIIWYLPFLYLKQCGQNIKPERACDESFSWYERSTGGWRDSQQRQEEQSCTELFLAVPGKINYRQMLFSPLFKVPVSWTRAAGWFWPLGIIMITRKRSRDTRGRRKIPSFLRKGFGSSLLYCRKERGPANQAWVDLRYSINIKLIEETDIVIENGYKEG